MTAEAEVLLAPLDHEQYEAWLAPTTAAYAREKTAAANWPPLGALARARAEFAQLLPAGPETPGHHLYAILDAATAEQVGVLWFAVLPRSGQSIAWVYDLTVFEPHRRRGYGLQAMRALEGEVRSLGLDRIELHVFGHNRGAQALYERAGYATTNVMMAKSLAAD